MSRDMLVVGLGRMPYTEALTLQRAAAEARIARTLERDVLFLVEHPPVVTLGRGFDPQHLDLSANDLAARGIELHEIDRGGDVTFHGPGQIVGYPIYDLTEHEPDLHRFLRQIEGGMIRALADLGLIGRRRDGLTGVWIDDRKIGSIGIHVRKWVTWHGFALNVTTDLSYFDLMVPCGIADVHMTSVQRELAERAPRDLWGRALDAVMLGFAEEFGQTPQAVTVDELENHCRGLIA